MASQTMIDGTQISKIISNVALTTNVATITTSTSHGLLVGQFVNIYISSTDTNYATFAPLIGTFIIASTPSATTFTYAKTTSNIASTATSDVLSLAKLDGMGATGVGGGTATRRGLVSPIVAASSEIALTAPPGATGLTFTLPSVAGTYRKVAGGATGGYFSVAAATPFYVQCEVNEVIYISRSGSTTIEFAFDVK